MPTTLTRPTLTYDWADYSLARINLIAKGIPDCVPRAIMPPPTSETDRAFRDALAGAVTEDDLYFLDLYNTLGEHPAGSLGWFLNNFYRDNHLESEHLIGTQGKFPIRYILLHDAHHALLDQLDTSEIAEINVMAFECGQLKSGTGHDVMPLTALVMAYHDTLKEIEDKVPLSDAAEWWAAGFNAHTQILDTWDIAADLPLPVAAVREKYGIVMPFHTTM